jgi:hypothetical protein
MSRKHVVPFHALKSADATINQTSPKTNCQQYDSGSYHIKFSAANSGEFIVEARNQAYESADDAETGWYEVSFGAPLSITAETDVQILFNAMDFAEIRLKWEPSAGSGTMNTRLIMKSKGA